MFNLAAMALFPSAEKVLGIMTHCLNTQKGGDRGKPQSTIKGLNNLMLKVVAQVCARLARLPRLQELFIGCVDVMGCTQPEILRAVATALRNLTLMHFGFGYGDPAWLAGGPPESIAIPSALFLRAVAAEVTKLHTLRVRTLGSPHLPCLVDGLGSQPSSVVVQNYAIYVLWRGIRCSVYLYVYSP